MIEMAYEPVALLFATIGCLAALSLVRTRQRSSSNVADSRDQKLAHLEPPPSDMGLPFIGKLDFLFDTGSCLRSHSMHSVWRTRVLGSECIIVTSAEASESMYRREGKEVTYTSVGFDTVARFAPRTLVGMHDVEEHTSLRQSLLRCFRPTTIALSVPTLQKTMERFFRKWSDVGHFDASKGLPRLALEVSLNFVGLHPEHMSEAAKEDTLAGIHDQFEGLFALPIDLGKYSALGRAIIFATKQNAQMGEVIADIRKRLDAGQDVEEGIPRHIVEALGDDGKPLSDETMQANLSMMVNATVDTTAGTMLSFMCTLCRHPEVQDRAHNHIKEILGPDSDEFAGRKPITVEQLAEMTYIDKVISECERTIPPLATMSWRKAARDFELEGYLVKKGTYIIVDAISRAMNSNYWKQPETFNPDRFDVESTSHQRLTPFGGGRRKCLGYGFANMSRKVSAVTLLRDYRLSFWSTEDAEKLKPVYDPLLKFAGGNLTVRIEARNKVTD